MPLLLTAVFVTVGAALLGTRAGNRPAGPPATPGEPAKNRWSPAPRTQGDAVSLVIDFGNGARREFDALPWSPGMTVGDLLRNARGHRPAVIFEQTGHGKTAFLTSLEGVTNGGAGGRNWLYEVDGRAGEVSFDVQPLKPGERVLWKFSGAE